jgi:hypothetical protein
MIKAYSVAGFSAVPSFPRQSYDFCSKDRRLRLVLMLVLFWFFSGSFSEALKLRQMRVSLNHKKRHLNGRVQVP